MISSEPSSEAGSLGILRNLCNPTDAIPTLKSGWVVYGCASLLGEQWHLSLGSLKLTAWGGRRL
jgi:hypothetical protein